MKISTRMKMLWFLLIAILAVYQVIAFLRLRRQHAQFFHSSAEMILVATLIAVMLVGIFVKSQKNSG